MSKKRYQFDGLRDGRWVSAWKEGRGRNAEVIVQIWNGGSVEGEPDGDWAMPGILPVDVAIEQAILQTPKEGE